jgi:hypothetical protein
MDITVGFEEQYLDDLLVKEITDDLERQAAKDARYKPYRVHIDSDHATMLEFGTNGSKTSKDTIAPRGKGKTKEQWSDAAKDIYDWAKARSNGELSDQEAYLIFRKIMEKGIPPQPFIRPALHEIEHLLLHTDTFKDKSVRDIMEMLRVFMLNNLQSNFTLYQGGTLKDKILVEEGYVDESAFENEDFLRTITEEMCQSDLMDLNGNEDRARERQENKDKLRFRS